MCESSLRFPALRFSVLGSFALQPRSSSTAYADNAAFTPVSLSGRPMLWTVASLLHSCEGWPVSIFVVVRSHSVGDSHICLPCCRCCCHPSGQHVIAIAIRNKNKGCNPSIFYDGNMCLFLPRYIHEHLKMSHGLERRMELKLCHLIACIVDLETHELKYGTTYRVNIQKPTVNSKASGTIQKHDRT